jgi:hypothetical protein
LKENKKMESNNEWIIALYRYLDSTLPDGAADEAFRVAPEAVRAQIAAATTQPGDNAGIGISHSQKTGCAEVAQLAAPAPSERQPVAYAIVMSGNICQLYSSEDAAISAKRRWIESYRDAEIKPLYFA